MIADTVVTDVDVFPIVTARRTGSQSSHVLFRVRVVAGEVGWGELSDLDCYRSTMPDPAALGIAARRLLVGHDAANINAVVARVRAVLLDHRYGARTYPPFSMDSQLAAAIEMACFDVTGRVHGRSISALLGGALRTSVPVAFPLFAVAENEAADGAFDVAEHAIASGVSTFRYYVGIDHDTDRRFLQAFLDRFHDRVTLKGLDFAGRVDWKSALRFVQSLDGIEVPLVESASWREDVAGLGQLRRALDADVCEHVGSTSQLMRLIAADAVDVVNVSIQSGGIHAARRLFEMADGAGLRCLLGTTQELSPGTAAGAHLAATVAELAHPADIVGPVLYAADPVTTPIRYVGSELIVPGGPGLGVDVDETVLAGLKADLVDWDHPAHGDNYVAR